MNRTFCRKGIYSELPVEERLLRQRTGILGGSPDQMAGKKNCSIDDSSTKSSLSSTFKVPCSRLMLLNFHVEYAECRVQGAEANCAGANS